MNQNHRKQPRRHVSYPVHIGAGDNPSAREGRLNDVSESGASIAVPAAKEIPDRFVLALGFMDRVIRRCQVMWRSDDRIGVKFISRAANPKIKPSGDSGS